jgi:hypothetical protein
MAIEFSIYKKDLLPILQFHLKKRDGSCVDLTDVSSITFSMGTDSTNLLIDHRACTVTDAEDGKAEYAWQNGDTNTVGTYSGEVVVTFQNGKSQSTGLFSVLVLDSLRP